MGKTWYRMTNLAGDRSEVMLYDEVGAWGVTASDFVKDLGAIKARHIDLRLNSPGGEVFDGLAIYSALKRHPADVTVHIDGLAASITSVIAMAGDQIEIDRHAQMMIHEAHAVAVGNTKDMASMSKLLDDYSNTIASIYAERAGGTVESWRERMKAETWFSAKEAVIAGLADEVASNAQAKITAQLGGTWDLSLFNFAGRANAPAPFAAAETGPEPVELPADSVVVEHLIESIRAEVVAKGGAASSEAAQQCELPGCKKMAMAGTKMCAEHTPPVSPAAVAEPPVLVEFDPAAFRDSVLAAAVLPFDPAEFRDTLRGLAYDAPAAPTVAPQPVDLGPEPGVPEPVPEPPDVSPWDHLRAAVRMAANDAPAPPQPNTTEDPAPEPGFFMDASAFTTALRRAKL